MLECVKQYGIISPAYAYRELKDIELTHWMLEKYRIRAIRWDKRLNGKLPHELTIQEIQQAICIFRQHPQGDGYIYALKFKIPKYKDERLDKYLENKIAVSFDIDMLSIIDIYWGGKSREFYQKVTEQDYWSNPIGDLLFFNIPHPAILTMQGRIKPENICIEVEDG